MFQHELDRALVSIALHPEIGASVRLRAYPNARSFLLRKSGYVVIYHVDAGAGVVAIARVRHARRRPLAQQRRQRAG